MLSLENRNFMEGFIRRREPLYKETIEGLTAQVSYRSLDGNSKLEFGVYSNSILRHPIFFLLSNEELAQIEYNLLPYTAIVKYVYQKVGVSPENVKEINKKHTFFYFLIKKGLSTKEKEIRKKLVSEEYEKIIEEYSKKIGRNTRKLFIPFYISTLIILLQSGNPYLLLPWLSTFAPYYLLTELSYKLKDRRISDIIRKASLIYLVSTDPIGTMKAMLEFEVGGSILGALIERGWKYFPKNVRKGIDASEKFLSGIKVGKFDEREIREELYEDSKMIRSGLPNLVFERFREDVENGIIEVEDAREIQRKPFSLGYWERRKVAELRGSNLEIVDKEYIKKLARIEGMPLKDFENLIRRRPWEFLRIDVDRYGNVVFAKDVIGVYPIKRPYGLRKGVEMKEIEACYLGIHGSDLFTSIFEEYGVTFH